MADTQPIRRALISVSDKSGLLDLARTLNTQGVEILSTGGTAKALAEAGLKPIEVADYTGFPELLDGRVKTLHPKVHGGLLGRRDVPAHKAAMKTHGIAEIDLLVVNLYPFEATVEAGKDFAACIENIDIGGPAMIRSAAKNHDAVTVIVDPADYAALIEEIKTNAGGTTPDFRRRMAAKAFARTAAYDAAIANWFAGTMDETFPERLLIAAERAELLRYGENPHQAAALYKGGRKRIGIATARQVQGKALSYNNLNDADAAFELAAEFDPKESAAVAIIKHANPCGAALGPSLEQAYVKALACDPVSAYGGIVAMNGVLDEATAAKIAEIFTEVIIAPEASEAAIQLLARKKNLRLLLTGGLPDPAAPGTVLRSLAGGYLMQTRDNGRTAPNELQVVTKRAPTAREMADLHFAFTVAKHVKSNAIVFVRDLATVGIGAGQMSRVDSSRIAVRKSEDAAEAAGEPTRWSEGAVAASDAFFPFPDGLLAAAAGGATAVIQPGGSMRDKEVIAAADEAGLAMVFTGMRHFRH